MINWFEIFAERLTAIEEGQNEIRALLVHSSTKVEADPYGDFKWLVATCPGIPASTLRIKSAAGEIPGVIKFGKRVLYEKAAVLEYLRAQTRQPAPTSAELEQITTDQINRQLEKRGGARA